MKNIRRIFTVFLVTALFAAGAFYFLYMRPRHVVPVLMYHAIGSDGEGSLYVAPENFCRQMRFLSDNGYSVISLDELVSGIEQEKRFPPKTVVITFDDGYEDNYIYAFPVLAKYEIPATIFLITRYVDARDEYLTWNQVRIMMRDGMDFGGHTRNGTYLPAIKDKSRLWNEINGSREDIKRNTGVEPGYFCYTMGGFNQTIKDMVKEAGYKGACTTNRGFDKLNKDVYELNRVKVTNSDTTKPLHFRAKLSGYYNLFRRARAGE